MTVYVDNMRRKARVGRLTAVWSHLQADTEAELYTFAARLGLRREWAQHLGTPLVHYDLTESKRTLAVQLGAIEITYMGADSMDLIRRKRAAFMATGSADLLATATTPAPARIPPPPANVVPPVFVPAPSTSTALSGLDFVALDFETANHDRASVCAVGAVRVRDGLPTETLELKVAPPAQLAHFHPIHVRIHGIRAADVVGAPDWTYACSQLVSFVGADIVVAHNAAFERSVISAACADAGFPVPPMTTLCTVALARKALPDLTSHKLPVVLNALGSSIAHHHNALADAYGAAEVAVRLVRQTNNNDLSMLAHRLRVGLKTL